jgi:hypothetical protein
MMTRLSPAICYLLKKGYLVRKKGFLRFTNLLQETVFLHLRNEYYGELDDMPWLIDLEFLTEVSLMPNGMNLQMQGGKNQSVKMISSIHTFKYKL